MICRQLVFLILLILSQTGFSDDYFQCSITDRESKSWSAKSKHHKMAVHLALEACKRESNAPGSCKKSKIKCDDSDPTVATNNGGWRCMALDYMARAWSKDYHPNIDGAAFMALTYCRQRSAVPETCYLNYITCEFKRD